MSHIEVGRKTFDQREEYIHMGQTTEALLDISQIAAALEMPEGAARMLLDIRSQPPAATYRGRLLWMRDSVDAAMEWRP